MLVSPSSAKDFIFPDQVAEKQPSRGRTTIRRARSSSLLDRFEKGMAEGPNPKKKHLLHRLVKKVLIHSRETVEIWYV